MNIISLASDLFKILQEQISILNSIISLKNSLNKLVRQKSLSAQWSELGITIRPKQLFVEAIDEKSKMIRLEVKKLR